MTHTPNVSDDAYLGASLVKTQYDKYLRMQLRAPGVMSQFVTVRPVQPTAPGNAIVLKRYNDLSAITAALDEDNDVDGVVVPATTDVTVTLLEYGNVVTRSQFLDQTALSAIDPAIADLVAQNVIESREGLIMTAARAGTNITYAGASGAVDASGDNVNDVASTDIIGAEQLATVVTLLRTRNAQPTRGESYAAIIHPKVSYDLRREEGQGTWRQVHEYSAAGGIWKGEVGEFEGASIIESNRVYSATDGSTSARVYRNLVIGNEAVAEAVANPFQVVIGPVVDRLMRFRHVGWKATVGYKVYREQALQVLNTSSSLG